MRGELVEQPPVGGVQRVGGRDLHIRYDANGGLIEARLRRGVLDPYPRIEIDGVAHRTGPSVPMPLRALALLPLALIVVHGLVGAVLGVAGLAANLAIMRTAWSVPARAALMVAVLAVAIAVFVGVGATLF